MKERRRIVLRGVVQGIGMRPFVYRLASELALAGWVRNDGGEVLIEVQGSSAEVGEFERRLTSGLPPAGRIDFRRAERIEPVAGSRDFRIARSGDSLTRGVSICADRAVCEDCLREMRDPLDRRFAYPFINCTACGPRFTIAKALPYDRNATTMDEFEMCPECRREYGDPLDRRYHAEPVACPACGPRVWLEDGQEGAAAVRDAALRLARGGIVAVKGIGGFHLAVDARNQGAVERLREIKHRPRKPLALMVRDLPTARRMALLREHDEALLLSSASPVVLVPKRDDSGLAPGVAPNLGDVGLMLPYSPLHHLLFQGGPDVLVMTSCNLPGEPIATTDDDARRMVGVGARLLHDREIHVANDDSVIRSARPHPIFIRRSRGYVPEPLGCPQLPERRVLALGAEWRVTVSTLDRGELVVGRHLGDLGTSRAEEAFHREVERMLAFTGFEPEVVAVDRHPDFASTIFAEERFAHLRLVRVQHHHAHMAAVLVENGFPTEAKATGIILDGFGLGDDGTIWGGEILVGGYQRVERAGIYGPCPNRVEIEPPRSPIAWRSAYCWTPAFRRLVFRSTMNRWRAFVPTESSLPLRAARGASSMAQPPSWASHQRNRITKEKPRPGWRAPLIPPVTMRIPSPTKTDYWTQGH